MLQKGIILQINGVSSAGETTLARAFQERMTQPWYLFGNDVFFDMLPEKLCNEDWPEAECLALEMLARTAKLFSDNGSHVILDTVYLSVMKRDCYAFLRETLAGHLFYSVHAICEEAELARRERERGDRTIGQAVWQLSRLLPEDGYDLIVDTFSHSPAENAEIIAQFLSRQGYEC